MSTMSMQAPHGEQNGEIDLANLFREVWDYKWLIVLLTFSGLMLGLLFAMRQPVYYRSNILMQVDSGSKQGAQNVQLLMGGGGSADTATTQIALMQSRFILEPVVDSLGLNINVTQRFSSVFERVFPWWYKHDIDILKFQIPVEDTDKKFLLVVEKPNEIKLFDAKHHLVLAGKMGKLLTNKDKTFQFKMQETDLAPGVQFNIVKRPDSVAAASLANKLSVHDVGGSTNGRAQATGVLEVSFEGKKRLETTQILNAIAKTAQVKDAQKKSEEASQTLSFLEHQLPISKELLESSEQAFNSYRSKSGKIDIEIQTTQLLGQLSALDTRLSELQIKKVEMQQRYKKIHPAWVEFVKQEDILKEQRTALEASLKKLPASDQIAANLMRDVEVKRTLYMLLLNKIQELQVVKAGTVSDVRILSNATVPNSAMPSKAQYFVVGAGVLGAMLGVLFVVMRKFISPLVEDPHWTERNLNLPNVSIVPYCKEQLSGNSLMSKDSFMLLAHSHPKNLAIEALRSLRTTLQVTLACANNNVIAILGIAPGVGKSFISANLAYLLAVAGKRVLLIDTDLRKGVMHKYFNQKSSPGLAEVLSGLESPEKAILNSNLNKRLDLLPRGHYPKNPSELLMGDDFKKIIQSCSDSYDVVVLDTPPILLVTDAVLVSAHSASNFLVMGASIHKPSDVELAVKRLNTAGVSVNGSIFNFHRDQLRGRYYGKYYNYSYYYEEKDSMGT